MDWGDDAFLAIDFETAASYRESACAVGLALFSAGELIESSSTLIDPRLPEWEWSEFNTRIHGLRFGDVAGAPTFDEVWVGIEDRYAGVPLVAHNASFDMGVITGSLAQSGLLPAGPVRYACSAKIARATWPEMRSVSLPVISSRLGIDLDHHEPESDAKASGQVLLGAARKLGTANLDGTLERLGKGWGEIHTDLTRSPRTRD